MNDLETKLRELANYLKEIEHYTTASNLMYWDMTTGMPEEAAESRAETMSFMSLQAHRLSIHSRMEEFINFFLEEYDNLDSIHKRMVDQLKKEYDKNKIYPESFVKEFSLATSKGEMAWEKAKNANDFSLFKDSLENIISLTKKSIEYRGFKDNKYNTLLDDYEAGLTVEKLDIIFNNLKEGIITILDKIKNSSTVIDDVYVNKTFSIEKQEKICIDVLNKMGFNFHKGRMDKTEHPYTTNMTNKDVRITNHYYENNLLSAIYSAIHEGGHGIYEQNIPDSLQGTNLDTAASMSIHESQSRFYENIVGKSRAFSKYLYTLIKDEFIEEFKDIDEDVFYNSLNRVCPSLIRTEADELTYSLHIIIRYEIEKMLINDEITVEELPKVWNDKYKEYLGVDVPSDKMGVLQDVHWGGGLFGYFPSYALGNIYGAQMLHKMLEDIPTVYTEIELGNLDSVFHWLKTNVHEKASLHDPIDLIKKITGEELNAQYFIEYLDNKYSTIYKY